MMPTALIFDCDGTLADTMPLHYKAWRATLDPLGLSFPTSEFYRLAGMPTAAIVAQLAEEQGVEVDVQRVCAERDERFDSMVLEVRPVAPVVAIAREHRGRLPMAVASGSTRTTVLRTLDTLGIRDWFGAIVTAEDTERHKPEPDVFLEAARRLGVEAAGCRVFEDGDLGLEAARRAGMEGVDIRLLSGVISPGS